jgi:cullin 3
MPDSGLDAMIDHDRTEDLSRLYRLFSLVPEGLATLRRALRYTVTERGKRINEGDLGAGISDAAVKEEEVEATSPVATGKGKGKAKPVTQGAGAQTLKLALKWVEEVLILKDKFDRVLRGAFGSDRELESGINEVSSSSDMSAPR